MELVDNGTIEHAGEVGEGNQDTTLPAKDAVPACDESGVQGCEGLVANVAQAHRHEHFMVEDGGVAVLTAAIADVDLIGGWSWVGEVRGSGVDSRGTSGSASGDASGRVGRRVTSGGNSSSDDGGDTKQLHYGQRV